MIKTDFTCPIMFKNVKHIDASPRYTVMISADTEEDIYHLMNAEVIEAIGGWLKRCCASEFTREMFAKNLSFELKKVLADTYTLQFHTDKNLANCVTFLSVGQPEVNYIDFATI